MEAKNTDEAEKPKHATDAGQPPKETHHAGSGKIGTVHFVLFAIIALVLIFNLYQGSTMSSSVEKAVAKAKEAATPAQITLTAIKDPKCPKCFDAGPVIEAIKKGNTNVTEEKQLSIGDKEASDLIKKYQIKKIPTVIITGETDKARLTGLDKIEDALVLTSVTPPYTLADTKKAVGFVELSQVVDSTCKKCIDLSPSIDGLRKSMAITKEKKVELASPEGKALVEKYDLLKIPTVLLSSDAKYYEDVANGWSTIGSVEKDGTFIVREVGLPFINTSSGSLVGLTTLTLLSDASCTKCYDVNIHKSIVARFGVAVGEEKLLDLSSAQGKDLVEKYKIASIPTITLSKDGENYPALVQVWRQVGDRAPDGTFIFRNNEVLNLPFKDLEKNTIVEPKQQEQQQTS